MVCTHTSNVLASLAAADWSSDVIRPSRHKVAMSFQDKAAHRSLGMIHSKVLLSLFGRFCFLVEIEGKIDPIA